MARTLTPIEVLPGNTFALAGDCYVMNQVLAANVPEVITVPTFTAQNGATGQAQFAFFNGTADFYTACLSSTDGEILGTPGTFAASTGWTLGSGWSIAAGVLTGLTASTAASYTPAGGQALIAGRYYTTTFTTSGVGAGSVALSLGGGTAGTSRSTSATFTETLLAGSSNAAIALTGTGFTGDIDNLTITPAAIVPTVDITNGYGMDLNPTQVYVGRTSTISIVSASTCIVSVKFFKY